MAGWSAAAMCAMGVGLMTAAGCNVPTAQDGRHSMPDEFPGGFALQSSPTVSRGDAALDPQTGRAVEMVEAHLDILTVELPGLSSEEMESLWNPIDELALPVEQAANLRANGLRIGVAGHSDWLAIQALLERYAAQSSRVDHVLGAEMAVSVKVGEVTQRKTIFELERGGSLSGWTFENADKILNIRVESDPAAPENLYIEVVPEISQEGPRKEWVQIDGRYRELPPEQGRRFDTLRARVLVPLGRFLVMGASGTRAASGLLGAHFFGSQATGSDGARMLFVAPQLYRRNIRGE